MRKFAFAAALASSTLALAACSGGADDAAVDTDETAAATDVEAAAETTGVLDASTAKHGSAGITKRSTVLRKTPNTSR